MHELRIRPKTCTFFWVKGHAGDENNEKADECADEGRLSDNVFNFQRKETANSRALHDGARLNALTMKIVYGTLIAQIGDRKGRLKNEERINETKYMVERETGLRPTTETLMKGVWKLEITSKAKDHLWNMIQGKMKCGEYWEHIPGYEERAQCMACLEEGFQGVTESEHHLWLLCPYNGQTSAWEMAKHIWRKTTDTEWPEISIALIRGAGAITLTDNQGEPRTSTDSERLRIIIANTVWAIWKTRNARTIQGELVHHEKTSELLKELIKDYITRWWNSLKFEKGKRRDKSMHRITNLWGDNDLVQLAVGESPRFGF